MRIGKGWCHFARQVENVSTFSPGYVDRVGFCDHTAGGFYSTLTDAGFWNRAGTSVHFAISRKGEIAQIVNIFDTAFAQGRLGPVVKWPGYAAMNYQNPNLYLISTEHEDAETVNGKTQFIPGSQWTPAQYAADLLVKRWCVEETAKYSLDSLRFRVDSLAGHHMFDSVNRAECPGRYWRDEYQRRLYEDLTGDPPMKRFNAVHPDFEGVTKTGRQIVNVSAFGAPASKLLRVEVFKARTEGRVAIGDGNGGPWAGCVEKGEPYGFVDVAPDVQGNITVDCDGAVMFTRLGVVGYW